LTLTPHEVRYLADMSPLLSTPRAVKKLLNLYQLVRAGVPEDDLDGVFLERNTGEYREVAILLAMLVGVPSHAAILLDEILNGPASQARDLSHIVAALRTEHKKSHVDVNTRQVRQCPACLNWHRIEAGLTAITGTSGVPSSVAAYRRWAREISRYSFHTESLWTSLTPEQQNEATKGWREV
jgi:hypothetical protein